MRLHGASIIWEGGGSLVVFQISVVFIHVLFISSLLTQEGIRVPSPPPIYFLIGPEMC